MSTERASPCAKHQHPPPRWLALLPPASPALARVRLTDQTPHFELSVDCLLLPNPSQLLLLLAAQTPSRALRNQPSRPLVAMLLAPQHEPNRDLAAD